MNTLRQREPNRREALAWLENAEFADESERRIEPYLDAAAVLETFSPGTLRPFGNAPDVPNSEVVIELTERARPVGPVVGDVWRLHDGVRRAALRRLGSRAAMRKARAVNPVPPHDPVQQGIDLLIESDRGLKLDALSLEQLLGVERAVGWFSGILAPLPSHAELARRIERERHLAPMRKIAGEGFVDRGNEREELAAYVGVLPPGTPWQGMRRRVHHVRYLLQDRPPLHLYGPGGVGKSALLARFILDHADPRAPQPLPFVYLDFDRAALDPGRPVSLLEDAIRQLLIEFPDVEPEFLELGDELRESVVSHDFVEFSKSAHADRSVHFVRRFSRLVQGIATRNSQPVLMVLDTLEEAECQGHSAMLLTWNLLSDLLKDTEGLRIVTAGRSELSPELSRRPVELKGLPPEEARRLVVERTAGLEGGPVSDSDADEIVSLVGTVPLSILLATRVVMNEGIAALRETVRRRGLFRRIKEEQQQGMLYGRILRHVREHDAELEKLANPGLVLRRITADIIQHVLAGPCQLTVTDAAHAAALLGKLERETGLVDPYREPGALWHQTPVRRIMLPELRATLGDTFRRIHEAAVGYYTGRTEVAERAELVYHHLWLDTDPARLDELWSHDLYAPLRGAFDELDVPGKIWLGDKLGIELPPELRRQAEYAVWERQAEQRARTMLAGGLVKEALTAVRERERPPRPSPLYALEADALKLLGRVREARQVIEQGLYAAERVGDRAAMLALVARDVFLYEATGELTEALERAERAFSLAQALGEGLEALSCGVAYLRIVRKLEAAGSLEKTVAPSIVAMRALQTKRQGLRASMLALVRTPEVRRALQESRPALLQEAAAELGDEAGDILEAAVATLGISSADRLALLRYADEMQGALDNYQLRALESLSRRSSSRGAGHEAAHLVPVFPEFFVGRVRKAVEDALQQTSLQASRDDRFVRVGKLSSPQARVMANFVAHAFQAEELDLLLADEFDTRLATIVPAGATPMERATRLLAYAEKHRFLDRLLIALGRSAPPGSEFNRYVRELFDASGGSAVTL